MTFRVGLGALSMEVYRLEFSAGGAEVRSVLSAGGACALEDIVAGARFVVLPLGRGRHRPAGGTCALEDIVAGTRFVVEPLGRCRHLPAHFSAHFSDGVRELQLDVKLLEGSVHLRRGGTHEHGRRGHRFSLQCCALCRLQSHTRLFVAFPAMMMMTAALEQFMMIPFYYT